MSTLTHRLLARPPYASLIDKLCGQDFPVIVVVKHKNTAGDLLITVTNYISMTSVGWFWGQVWSTGNRHLLKSQCKKKISLIWLSLTFIQKVHKSQSISQFSDFLFFSIENITLGTFFGIDIFDNFYFQNLLLCSIFWQPYSLLPKWSTTPIMAMGCRQCLPLSIYLKLIGKHWQKPHCHNGVVDHLGPCPQTSTPEVTLNYIQNLVLMF